MNQLYRLTHMPLTRAFKKIIGYKEIYTIGIRKKGKNTILFDDYETPFDCIPYDGNYWYADPLIYTHNNEDYLFVEKYNRSTNKGEIAVTKLPELNFKTIIKEKYHMSFPCVFKWDNDIYMLPETSENSSVNIYKCINFPFEWIKIKENIINKNIVDSIPTYINDQKIIFLGSEICQNNELMTRYQQFELNNKFEIKLLENNNEYNYEDRNAGYITNNYLVKQESTSVDYGKYICFSKDTNFIKVGPLDINFNKLNKNIIIGVHTYSIGNKYEVIDARYLWKK